MAKFKSGLLWGAFFGGLAGLMNAPRPGVETREILKEKIDQTTDDVNDVRFKVDNLKIAVQRLADEGIRGTKEVVDELQTTLKHFEVETQPRVRRIQAKTDTLTKNIEAGQEELTLN